MGEFVLSEDITRWFPQTEPQLVVDEESKVGSTSVEASGLSNASPSRASSPIVTSSIPSPPPSSSCVEVPSPPAEGPASAPTPSDGFHSTADASGAPAANELLPRPVMCTPRTAQELSEVTPRYYAVKDRSHPQDLIPEDESTVPGLELHGYLAGKPVYRSTTGIQARLKAIETLTAVGTRYVPQPIDSCFEPRRKNNSIASAAADGASSSSSSSSSSGRGGFGDSGYGGSGGSSGSSSQVVEDAEGSKPGDGPQGRQEQQLENVDRLPSNPSIRPDIPHVADRSSSSSRRPHDESVGRVPPNRTFANEWIAVRRSPLGGYGIFAARDMPRDTHFLLERPFVLIRGYQELAARYAGLGEEERLVYDGLHGFDRNSDDPVKKRWNANSFFLHHREAVLAIASNFNHACHARRNVQYWWDDRRRVMVFTATEGPVARGEELLISYGEFRDALFEKFGFVCRCGACEGEPWEAAPSQLDF